MAKIVNVKDENDQILYPMSVLAAIYKDPNTTAEQYIDKNINDVKAYLKESLNLFHGFVISDTAPENTNQLWIDSSNNGAARYYNSSTETWETVKSVWG